jgi:hypothetical protein
VPTALLETKFYVPRSRRALVPRPRLSERLDRGTALAALPVAAWELSLGVWLVVKGFKPSPVTAGMVAASTPLAERGIAG